ncbi:putative RNA methyltransferase [Arthrobacter sp. JSM 101049]|uniref:putative RNA methyltransferase n=1 Tax=Arthrobacter sp. JSM 101049 TaxID=929097 RepID=UPI0035627DC7
MIRESIALSCPVCAESLEAAGSPARVLSCPAGHRFDAAKQGYFNLLTGRGTTFREDTPAMVEARARFLAAGHYAPLADALAEESTAVVPGGIPRILDAGAGTGYYLDTVAGALEATRGARPEAVALDISRFAMRRAAKLPRTRALVWDLWRPLPVADAQFEVLMDVFAPRNGGEFSRVLVPGGVALVATPLPDHLAEAIGPLGMLSIGAGKEESVAAALGPAFEPLRSREIRTPLRLSDDDAVRLALMGPAGHHHDEADIRRRLAGSPLPDVVTAAFRLQVFRRR